MVRVRFCICVLILMYDFAVSFLPPSQIFFLVVSWAIAPFHVILFFVAKKSQSRRRGGNAIKSLYAKVFVCPLSWWLSAKSGGQIHSPTLVDVVIFPQPRRSALNLSNLPKSLLLCCVSVGVDVGEFCVCLGDWFESRGDDYKVYSVYIHIMSSKTTWSFVSSALERVQRKRDGRLTFFLSCDYILQALCVFWGLFWWVIRWGSLWVVWRVLLNGWAKVGRLNYITLTHPLLLAGSQIFWSFGKLFEKCFGEKIWAPIDPFYSLLLLLGEMQIFCFDRRG